MTIGSQRAIRVLGFAGSLRRGSYNRALLRAASELAPEGMLLDIFDLLPLVEFCGRLYHVAREASFEAKAQGQSRNGVGGRWVVVVGCERSIRSNQWVGGGYADAEHRSESPNHSL